MNRFRLLALAAFVVWCSAVVGLSARQGGAANAAGGDQQARGKALYNDKCASCHMENLKGSTETPPLTGDMFWMNWETYSANNLVEQVRTTMPEDNPGALMRQEYVDIVAFILKTNGVPFTGDLPMDTDALKMITIKKP
jgi:mono/diheme cytochrome c family protein